MTASEPTAIPEPPGYPIIGNIADIDPNSSLNSFNQLADKYGQIYRIRFPGASLVIVSTFALVDELCDETKFKKVPSSVLSEIRNGVHDGLFTAHSEEPNWGIAHRVLMPAFGPKGIQAMFDEMHDIASQLILKWARQGPDHKVHLTDDFTKLALDTLALCSMGFRFNNFYTEQEHRFVGAMADFLTESGRRTQRLPLPALFYHKADAGYQANISILRQTAETVLQERVAGKGHERKDLLNAMLEGRDSQTGNKMTDASIIDNLITFLIAGHETTSGTLSYAMYELVKHPEAYLKVQEEVDNVIGQDRVNLKHLQKLPYIEAVLRETLRLDAPIPIVSRTPIEDETILGGEFVINKNDTCLMLLSKSHLDPNVFDDPTAFRPERMLSRNFNQLPQNAWKPFGTGARACIGRPFAWQESLLAMALMFQNFDFEFADPNYVLEHKQTLTIKPKDLYFKIKARDGLTATRLSQRLSGSQATDFSHGDSNSPVQGSSTVSVTPLSAGNNPRMTILYGSNSGTCELMAQRLASDASSHGFSVASLGCLDKATAALPRNEPVIILTSSYEGQPPDNAVKFVSWIESIRRSDQLRDVKYAVFGCGNHDWPQTLHRIPKLVDDAMLAAGAQKIADTGFADAASEDVFTMFEIWEDGVLWPALKALDLPKENSPIPEDTPAPILEALISESRPSYLGYNMSEGRVVTRRLLTAEGDVPKVHLEIELPVKSSFRPGDYLHVLPVNQTPTVLRALRRFRLHIDSTITLQGSGTRLPTGVNISAQVLLSEYVELDHVATRKQIYALLETAGITDEDRKRLTDLSTVGYDQNILAARMSLLAVLEQFPTLEVLFGEFLYQLPLMRTRQYSISSSALANPKLVALTVSLAISKTNPQHNKHIGVASSYLMTVQPNDMLWVSVKHSHEAFHLPSSYQNTPLIMISAGSGIGPFRGFIQERAILAESGKRLAPAFLYHGCRQPGHDDLYADELNEWQSRGLVVVKRAYSRAMKASGGSKYVQDAVWADRQALLDLWHQGCFLYVCGSKEISREVTRMAIRFKQDISASRGQNIEEEEAKSWWEGLRNVRYAFDVFD